MTSIIQAMNSKGVAFATDSAVSWGNHSRNSAQKLFSLPGRQPIAFMIMGSGVFAPAGLSWDRIFYKYNLYYSEKYGPEVELETVGDYEKDFIGFLESLTSVEDNERALVNDIWSNWAGENGFLSTGGYFTIPDESKPIEDDSDKTDVSLDQFEKPVEKTESADQRGLKSIQRLLDDWSANSWWMGEESLADIEFQYKVEQIEKYHADSLGTAAEWIMMSGISLGENRVWNWEKKKNSMLKEDLADAEILRESLYQLLKRWLAAWGNYHNWKEGGSKSDVIFGGFGKDDDFPKTIQIVTGSRVSGLGNSGDLVYCRNAVDPKQSEPYVAKEDDGYREWRCSAYLEALAQNEFIMRMTTGLSSNFRDNKISAQAQHGLEGWLKNGAIDDFGGVDGIGSNLVKSITSHLKQIKMPEDFAKYLSEWIYNEQISVKSEFRRAVLRLSPIELAELASDLIGVQAKMHNIVNSQSSVDLPVDVCYLSKENGFIWHSRKNMPDLNLNPKLNSMNWQGSQTD